MTAVKAYHVWGRKKEEAGMTVITISREPGSGGNILANSLSERLGYGLFYQPNG